MGESTGIAVPQQSDNKLGSYWHPVARVEEITDQPRQFSLLDEKIVVFRCSDGVAVFKDLCIHRGAALSLGRIENETLTCAYHGWQYDFSGACVRIPSRPKDSPIPRKAHAITYQAAEKHGLVWVALEEPVAPIPFLNEDLEQSSWRAFISYDMVWETSAARAVENFMDFSHFPFVHEGLLGSRDQAFIRAYEVLEKDYGMVYTNEEELREVDDTGRLDCVRHEYNVHLPFTIHLRKIEPNGDITVKSLFCCPISAKRSRVFLLVSRNHSFERPDSDFGDFANTVMEQDRVVVESQRPEEIPLDLREELHIKVPDAASILYRRQLAQLGVSEPILP